MKLAKIHHPDVILSDFNEEEKEHLTEQQKYDIEDKFKEISEAYERVTNWIAEVRDIEYPEELAGVHKDYDNTHEDGSQTFKFGIIKVKARPSTKNREA